MEDDLNDILNSLLVEDDLNNSLNPLFVDHSERQVAILGGSYFRNFLSTGSVEKGFCTVSTSRVYFKGKCYYKENGKFRVSKEERIVDLDDVTGSGFTHANIVPMIVKAILGIITAVLIIIGVYELSTFDYPETRFIMAAIPFLLLLICAYIHQSKIFEISYAGGSIAFKASNYTEDEIQEFQTALRKAKDEYVSVHKSQTVVQPIQVQPQPQQATMSIADELKQYKELLDSGVLTQEEFDKMKKKLLG